MFENKPRMFACETKGHSLENDVVEMMKIIQNEMDKRGYKAVIMGLVKDNIVVDLSNLLD